MTGVLVRRAAACIAVFALSSVALAQGLRDRDPVLDNAKRLSTELQRATLHSGAWYLLSSFQISDVGYERSDQFFVPTDDQTSGITLNITAPHRLYFVPTKKFILSADVVPGYSLFRRADDSNQFNYLLRADAQAVLNHLYVDLYVSRSDALRANTGELNRLVTAVEDSIGLNSEIKYSSKTSFLVAASHRDTTYPRSRIQPEDQPVERLGRRENNLRVSGIHKTFAHTSLLLAAETSEYDFKLQPGYTNSSRRYVAPGVLWESDRSSFRLEGGPATLDFDGVGKDFKGFLANAEGSIQFGKRWNTTARLNRDVEFSVAETNNYYLIDRAVLQINYLLTQRLSLRSTGHIGRDIYETPINGIKRKDDLSFISGGFIYSTRRLRGGLEVGYFQRDSNIDIGRQSGIRMIVNLSINP